MATHYKRVYSPQGEPVDVPHDRAADLVLNKNWSHSPAVAAEPIERAVSTTAPEPARQKFRRALPDYQPAQQEPEPGASGK